MSTDKSENEHTVKSRQLEAGFICRLLYCRGGATLPQMVYQAKSQSVCESWFTDPTCRVIWRTVETLFGEKDFDKVNIISVIKEVPKIISKTKDREEKNVKVDMQFFLDAQQYVRAEDDLASYALLLRDSYIENEAKRIAMETMEAVASGIMSGTEALSRMAQQAQYAMSSQRKRNKLSISELAEEVVAQYREAHHQIVELGNYEYTPGLRLPWRKLAYSLNGFGGDLHILAARPGVGKTSMAMNFSRFWLDCGYKVMFNSVDMSPLGFVKRQLAEKTRISSRQMQFAKSDNFEEDIKKIEEEVKRLKQLEEEENFSLYSEYDVDEIKANCAILKEQGMIDVLIIDYLQLLTCKGSGRMSTVQKTTYISNTLHSIAVELQIPVLCLSQLNRDNTKDGGREPKASDLRDSGAIEQDAATIMLLYRDDTLYAKWKDDEPPAQFFKNRTPPAARTSYCPVWCLIAKSREGDEGTKIPFVVIQNKFAWYQADPTAKGHECFEKVYDDWRHAPIEKIWEENGSLIKMADVRAEEQFNMNQQRIAKGLPPINFNPDQPAEDLGITGNNNPVSSPTAKGNDVNDNRASSPSSLASSYTVAEPAPWESPTINPSPDEVDDQIVNDDDTTIDGCPL